MDTAGIDPCDHVLDVGCGTGNAALTARRNGANVVGVDVTRPMLALARESSMLAEYEDITWTEGDAQALPFPAETFDVTVSNFGHVFAPNPSAAGREMTRVTKSGGRLVFTAWSPDGLVGRLTEVLSDYVSFTDHDPRRHLQWCTPAFVRSELGDVCELSFQRRIAQFRYVSPQHFWREFAEESGPLSPALRELDDEAARQSLREEALTCLDEWFADNAVRVEYLLVRGVID